MKKLLFTSLFLLIFPSSLICGCSTSQYVSPASGVVDHVTAEQVMKLLNEARTRGMTCGSVYFSAVQPVRWNEKLARASLDHSLDMAKNGFMGHKGSDGSGTDKRLARAGYAWSAYGENVGQGYKTAGEAVNAWLKSEMHCRNIMNPDYKETGAAFAKSKNLRTFWTLVLGTPP
ncbi:MAG: CAP domain-containing protein [Thermodesulfovibrionales bacterium]|nr:CAP domain-containing protein [Thermodesulfovibrionales bacterium]